MPCVNHLCRQANTDHIQSIQYGWHVQHTVIIAAVPYNEKHTKKNRQDHSTANKSAKLPVCPKGGSVTSGRLASLTEQNLPNHGLHGALGATRGQSGHTPTPVQD